MINIEELRADIEAGAPGDWCVEGGANSHVFDGRLMAGKKCLAFIDLDEDWGITTLPPDTRRIARLPQLEREYLAMREVLEYYADKNHYDSGEVPGHIYVLDDGGRYARNALGETQ